MSQSPLHHSHKIARLVDEKRGLQATELYTLFAIHPIPSLFEQAKPRSRRPSVCWVLIMKQRHKLLEILQSHSDYHADNVADYVKWLNWYDLELLVAPLKNSAL